MSQRKLAEAIDFFSLPYVGKYTEDQKTSEKGDTKCQGCFKCV